MPGRVVRVKKAGCLEANNIYPKPDDAKEMLRRAMEELTGKADLSRGGEAVRAPATTRCA